MGRRGRGRDREVISMERLRVVILSVTECSQKNLIGKIEESLLARFLRCVGQRPPPVEMTKS